MTRDLPTIEECSVAMLHVQSFLHGELTDAQADEVRRHLMACEACLDYYDSETLISARVRRSCEQENEPASEGLRTRLTSLHVVISID